MRKIILIILFFGSISTVSIHAQNTRLNLYGNYAFDDKINFYNLNVRVNGGFMYGAGLEYMLGPKFGAELQYQRMNSDLSYYYKSSSTEARGLYNYSLNYVMAGFNNYLPLPQGIEPYYGLLLGMSIMDLQSSIYTLESKVKFAWGARVGANVALSRQLSLRLQAELRSIVESVDADLSIGSGGLNPVIVTNSVMYQFNLGAGLVYKLK